MRVNYVHRKEVLNGFVSLLMNPILIKCSLKKKKFYAGVQTMVWGMIGPKGGLELCEVDGRETADYYIEEILDKYVKTN